MSSIAEYSSHSFTGHKQTHAIYGKEILNIPRIFPPGKGNYLYTEGGQRMPRVVCNRQLCYTRPIKTRVGRTARGGQSRLQGMYTHTTSNVTNCRLPYANPIQP